MKLLLLSAGILAVFVVAACGGDDATNTPQSPTVSADPTNTLPAPTVGSSPISSSVAQGTDVTSDIVNFALEDLVIRAGTTVTWVQLDASSHTSTNDVGQGQERLWDSPTMREGDTFVHTFGEAGVFPYFCRIHPGTMVGTVTVVAN